MMIACSTSREWKKVCFRFEIQYQDGDILGTMLSENSVDFEASNSTRVLIEFDASHLVPGRYRIDIVAYVFNEFGSELFLDGVYPGFMLEVKNGNNSENKLNWNHKFWGHTRLHDIKIRLDK